MPNLITLDSNSPSVKYLCQKDKRLAKVVHMVGPISYAPHDEDTYPFLIREIIEQMLSIKAGQKIYGRLEDLCHGNITPEHIALLSDEQIRGVETSSAKVNYICNMTNAIMDGSVENIM